MIYVIDSSVAFKWVVSEPHSDKAIKIRDDYLTGVNELLAPDVYPIEVGHALTRAERQKRIPVGSALALLGGLLQSLPKLEPSLSLLIRACEISSQERVGIYDCLYVALAEREQCEFVTADDKLVRRLGVKFPFIKNLSNMP